MKNTPQILTTNRRLDSDSRVSRRGARFPQAEQNYQSDTLLGSCGTTAEFTRGPSFFRISNDYFAHEAPRGFAVDAGVFTALMVCAMVSIVNGVEAVSALIRSVGVL
ncbi:MAG: hypothetical protein H0T83_01115 [Chthoniobacterales bacterium]|nr:hypothetical protein [Chthoniobacterales bacterium]